jgi:outer membrane protein OmpA-like peptidoglycan-associated protein
MINKKRIIASLITSFCIVSSIQAQVISNASSDQTKIIVYRGNSHYYAPHRPAKLFIDNNYIGNVEKNDYVEFCLNPMTTHNVSSHLQDAFIYSDKNRKNFVAKFETGATYIFKINDDEHGTGEPVLMDLLNAQRDLNNKKEFKLINNNSSDIQNCKAYQQPAPVAMVTPVVPYIAPLAQQKQSMSFSLAADGIFEFNKSDIKDLKEEGRRKLDSIIDGLNKNNSQVDVINVTGHADRLGGKTYNQDLSQKRANTIKAYLMQNNVKSSSVNAIGKGSDEPIVYCSQKNHIALINCLSPNRRITVDIKSITSSN